MSSIEEQVKAIVAEQLGVKEDEVKKLFSKQWKITEDCFPVQSIQTRKGREKLIVFEKL